MLPVPPVVPRAMIRPLALLFCAAGPWLGAAPSSAPLPVAAAPAADVLEVRLIELMSFDYRRGRRLPDWVRALDGERVRIEGYMALGTPEGEKRFELVWDSCNCGSSQPNHFVEVTLPEDRTTEFNPELIAAVGRFEVGEVIEDGFVKSLFRLKAEKIEE